MTQRAVIRGTSKKPKKVPSKMCTRCGSIKPIDQFFSNKAWASQSFRDAWCSECARSVAKDKEGMREYCWYNNRTFMERVYDDCQQQAIYQLATDPAWLKTNSEDRKKTLLAAQMSKHYFSRMNLVKHYLYVDNMKDDGPMDVYDEASDQGMVKAENDELDPRDETKLYSEKWNGMFTRREIDFLDKYFAQLEEDFTFATASKRDYAMKVCKASLDADNAYNKYRGGSGTLDDYKKAMELFDKLSKAAEFAECERKQVAGVNSFGEWSAKVEALGDIEMDGTAAFPKDWVDKVTADFRHTLVACGLGGDSL